MIQRAQSSPTPTIDIFTQKEPCSGRGINQPGDAFTTREEVILFALLADNAVPLENQEVIFEIIGPSTVPVGNNTFTLTAFTNASGIATTSFVLPWAPQGFGVWNIYAKADIFGVHVQDHTWFTVYWIVDILLVKTGFLYDFGWVDRIVFAKGDLVDIEITLKSIAWIEKNITVTATIYDSLGVPVSYKDLRLIIPANSTKTIYLLDLEIPKWAFSCYGQVIITALSPDEIPYSPEKKQTIKILPCGLVGGVNFLSNITFHLPWTLAIAGLITLTVATSSARKRHAKKHSSSLITTT